jgi:hypothetical protein
MAGHELRCAQLAPVLEQLEWLTANTLLLKEKHWDKELSKSWFTYARLTIQ